MEKKLYLRFLGQIYPSHMEIPITEAEREYNGNR